MEKLREAIRNGRLSGDVELIAALLDVAEAAHDAYEDGHPHEHEGRVTAALDRALTAAGA